MFDTIWDFIRDLAVDPPVHTRLRRLTEKAFTAHRVKSLEPRIRQIVSDLIEPLAEQGHGDGMKDIGAPLTAHLICEQLGLDFGKIGTEKIAWWTTAVIAQIGRMQTREEMVVNARTICDLQNTIIAEIEGLATAAGLQLVASCDLAVAAHEATFCTPGVHIGLFCSTPMVALSRNASRKQAMEMLLTGETIDAATAKEFGLVNRVVPREYHAQVVNKYAETIASKSPLTLKIGKEAFYKQVEMGLADAYDYTARVMVDNMLARDAEEGIGAFVGKRKPEWKGE